MPDAGAETAALVDVVFEDDRWQAAGLEAIAERAARAVLVAEGRDPDRHEIALLACDDVRIADLNGTFRDKPQPTNVLSWPEFEGPVPDPDTTPDSDPLFIGDLAMAWETCQREAEAAGISMADHATHLVVHGVLHLLGHDHLDDAEAETMETIETNVLARMGIANPYSH